MECECYDLCGITTAIAAIVTFLVLFIHDIYDMSNRTDMSKKQEMGKENVSQILKRLQRIRPTITEQSMRYYASTENYCKHLNPTPEELKLVRKYFEAASTQRQLVYSCVYPTADTFKEKKREIEKEKERERRRRMVDDWRKYEDDVIIGK